MPHLLGTEKLLISTKKRAPLRYTLKTLDLMRNLVAYVQKGTAGRKNGCDGWSDERCDRSTYGLICSIEEATLHVDSQVAARSKCSMTNGVISG